MGVVTKPGFDELAGKVVLVTGGSTGIGAAVARAFAACGAVVAVHFNASREQAEAVVADAGGSGGRAFALKADLTRPGSGEALVGEVMQREGRLDVLVNNAGTILGRRATQDVDDAFYRELIDLNLTSVVSTSRAAIPILRRQGSGTIISTTSVAARMGGGPGTVIYAATKAAIATFTRGLARELAPEGLRVNAVAPGVIQTPLHDRFSTPEVMQGFAASIPMRRIGSPEDMAGAYLFLACERLSGYVTGQIIEVNGGMAMP